MEIFSETNSGDMSTDIGAGADTDYENVGINYERIFNATEQEHEFVLDAIGLSNSCGCGSKHCENKPDRFYSCLRIVVDVVQLLMRNTGNDKFYNEALKHLEELGSKELAELLMYAIARSNNIEKAYFRSKKENQ